MSLRVSDTAPDSTAEISQGTINFHDWIGDGWAIPFSRPKHSTPICTTEIGYLVGFQADFSKRNCKIIRLSVNTVTDYGKWTVDIEETQGHEVTYLMIGDRELKAASLYDMLPAEAGDSCEGRSAVNNQTVRTLFVFGPDKKIRLTLSYPMSTGRNFNEVLQVVDSMRLTAKRRVATTVNWEPGEDVNILPLVSDGEAKKKLAGGRRVPRPYLRILPPPSCKQGE